MLKSTLTTAIFTIMLAVTTLFSQQTDLNQHAVKFENPSTISIVGENGLVMRTTNNGMDWTEQNTNVTNVLFGASIKDGISLAVGENGVIIRSVDFGNTWDVILPGTVNRLNDVDLYGTNAVVCGDNGTIFYSGNGGQNWSTSSYTTTKRLNDVKFISSNTGFIAGELAEVLKTTDGGMTWVQLNTGFANQNLNAIEAIDENNICVVGDAGTIFMSNDGGNTWFGANGLMYENNINDVVFFNANTGVATGDNGLILRTEDGGYSWQPSEIAPGSETYDFQAVSFYDANIGISVGNEGKELYTVDGGITWTIDAPNLIATFTGSKQRGVSLMQNYPNPFNPSTVINYELPYSANVTVKVYDISGKEVASLFNGFQAEGNHSVQFNASNLSSGVYFYRLNVVNGTNSITKVNKMILTK